MKKIILLISLIPIMWSCGGAEKRAESAETDGGWGSLPARPRVRQAPSLWLERVRFAAGKTRPPRGVRHPWD